MAKLIASRLALSLFTLLLVSLILFAATEILPGDVATAVLGREATPETLARLRAELGLDKPPVERYLRWLGRLLRGDLGDSLARSQPISGLVRSRLRNSLLLCAAAGLTGIPLAILAGIVAGLYRDRLPDTLISLSALVGLSLPEYVTATVLIFLFAILLRLFPAVTTVPPDAPITAFLRDLPLPSVSLAIVMAAPIVRLLRTGIIDVMTSDYIQMAVLKGVPRRVIVLRHALPNCILPTINAVALTLAWLVGGVVVVETVFNYPGFGRLIITAVHDRDVPLVQALGMISAGVYVAANLSADLLALALNPRLRTLRG